MSYEHGSAGNRFNLPNPMKVENLFLGLAGSVCVVLGMILLGTSPGRVGMAGQFADSVIGALILLIMGGTYAARAASQLRFFFGRGRPQSLAPEVPRGRQGDSPSAETIKETLRQQAIVYPEPEGPLDGLLYTWVPNLIYAPRPIQGLARKQFGNAIRMAFIALLLCMALVSSTAAGSRADGVVVRDWIGFGAMVYLLAVHLFSRDGAHPSTGFAASGISVKGVAVRLVVAVVGPVLLMQVARELPPPPVQGLMPHVFVMIILAFSGFTLVFLALLREGNEAPPTGVSQVQEAWSIRCHPGMVVGEFDRVMQSTWREQIPNRVYTRMEPIITPEARTGQFSAEMVEEYQPLPLDPRTPSLAESLRNPDLKYLVGMTALAATSLLASGLCIFAWGLGREGGVGLSNSLLLTYGVILGALAWSQHRVGHALWQRFDFGSVIVFCEMKGQYVTASMEHGNLLRDALKATSSVTQIESMTFRIWVARLHTVAFGKDAQRHLRSMQRDDEAANNLAAGLRNFVSNQAILIAPSSRADRERQTELQAMNAQAALSAHEDTDPGLLATSTGIPTLATSSVSGESRQARFCTACGTKAETVSRFCGSCGAAIPQS